MNYHQRLLPPGVNRALRSLSLLLLALIFPRELPAMPRLHFLSPKTVKAAPIGYLPALGAPGLRFQAVAPVAKPRSAETFTSSAPSISAPKNVSIEVANSSPVASAAPAAVDAQASVVETRADEKPSAPTKNSPQIIPDDTRRAIRPEDFLQFFQFPPAGSANGTLNVVVPVPREPSSPPPLAPSSATYTQSPK
jgi:hypothetical protein